MAFRFLWYLILNCATFMWYQELMLRRCGRGRFSMTLVTVILGFYIPGLGNVQGNPTFRHLGNTVTSLLRPLFFATLQNGHTVPCKKKKPRHWNGQPLIRPNFCGPLMVVLTGFHGNWLNNHSLKEHEVSMERYKFS